MKRFGWIVLALCAALVVGCTKADGEPTDTASGGDLESARVSAGLAACPEPGLPAADDEDRLPDLALPCLGGGADVSLRTLTGVPTVINLWATWCRPCRDELPLFQSLADRADPSELRVLGVVTEDPGPERALRFVADVGVRIASLVDDSGDLAKAVAARGLPTTVFVDADGAIAYVYSSHPFEDSVLLDDLVHDHLDVTVDG